MYVIISLRIICIIFDINVLYYICKDQIKATVSSTFMTSTWGCEGQEEGGAREQDAVNTTMPNMNIQYTHDSFSYINCMHYVTFLVNVAPGEL